MKKIIGLIVFSLLFINCSSDAEDDDINVLGYSDNFIKSMYSGTIEKVFINYENPEFNYSNEVEHFTRPVYTTEIGDFFDTPGGWKYINDGSLKFSGTFWTPMAYDTGYEIEIEIRITGEEMTYNSIEYSLKEGDDKRYSSLQRTGILYKKY